MLNIRTPAEAATPGARDSQGGFWPMRDLPMLGWIVAAAVISFVHPFVPAPRWLMIHLLLLGAAGHSILVWSRYFADTVGRLPATPRREQSQRLMTFNLGVLAVILGVPGQWWWLVVAGATAVAVAVLWHVAILVRGLRSQMKSRFSFVINFYVAAGLLLPIGVALGTWIASSPGEPLETRLRFAHVAVNLLGFIGLTVLGTLVTLGPTMLRTKIVDGAERLTQHALWALLGGIALVSAAAWADVLALVAVGLVLYAGGVGLVAWPLLQSARRKRPAAFPTWSVYAGLGWLFTMLVTLAVKVALTDSWPDAGAAFDSVTPYLAAGFVAQVLLGALSYLIPVVMGGGPSAVREMNRNLDAGGALRVSLVNLGLLVCVLPVPSVVRVIASALALGALAAFVPVFMVAIRRRRLAPPVDTSPGAQGYQKRMHNLGVLAHGNRPKGQNTGLAAVGLALVMIAVALGGAIDPTALGGSADSAADGVAATGKTVRVTVVAKDMRFTPDHITVDAGDRLVITVKNTDATNVHDLVLETGHTSGRLAPGESATVDVGVVGKNLDGWCSVVGHRQMGMVMSIEARGAPAEPGQDGGQAATGGDTTATDPHAGHDLASGQMAMDGTPAEGTVIADPTLPPVPAGRVHRMTFTMDEQQMEVAPGVVQEVWTYNGTAPGPTLHGRVGDRFVITVKNEGTIGHSLDFHAGERDPQKVMRTVPPGGQLVYRFTARRAGAWLYHCSTMPMSAHIANGMFGAVVIDPPELAPVDHQFILTQSEHYYGPDGQSADLDKLAAEEPDAVVFNGYHNAYDHEPIKVKVGERVRFWVVDAGPDRPLSFHIVGEQFDTTYLEGDWRLGSARGPARSGGSQALGLMPAQGGFVEVVFDEPGSYPIVNHVMLDAERGAHGTVEVTR